MSAYYNENDPFAAQWLRNLIGAGLIAPGDVDERDIRDVAPADVRGYAQAHFFAGIGLWSYALRLAHVPDDARVWTGSCPCQPFSVAGRGGGFDDARHLWPVWFDLIDECRPPVCFGEQVASPDGLLWLDLVYASLEGAGYAVAAADLPASCVGAPHARQRLFFVADAPGVRREPLREEPRAGRESESRQGDLRSKRRRAPEPPRDRDPRGLADALGDGRGSRGSGETYVSARGVQGEDGKRERLRPHPGSSSGSPRVVGDTPGVGWERRERSEEGCLDDGTAPGRVEGGHGPLGPGETRPLATFWADADWLPCRDGKARPVEPGTFPLAHGSASRVGRLRAYGNAIVPQAAAVFIRAWLETKRNGEPQVAFATRGPPSYGS